MLHRARRTRLTAASLAAVVCGAAATVTSAAQAAAPGCRVDYAIGSQWGGGFSATVTVTNLGDPVADWAVRWSFTAGQTVAQAWNATATQTGAAVTAVNTGWNGPLATNASASFGFNGSWNNSTNPVQFSATSRPAGARSETISASAPLAVSALG